MTVKHSKGPWVMRQDHYGKISIGPTWLDVVAEINQHNEKSQENANLIVCAPDLLKIAVSAMKYIESIPDSINIEYEGEKIDKQWAEKIISIATSKNI